MYECLSAKGDADLLPGEYAGDEEADLFLVVVADGIDPVAFIFLPGVHEVHETGHVVHGPSILHLAGFVVQFGDGLVEGVAVAEEGQRYRPQTIRFFPIRFCTNRLKAWFIID
jgi:hypothetical protein